MLVEFDGMQSPLEARLAVELGALLADLWHLPLVF